jgi:protein-S-isoprenylcysteine O-methyltransferase Ste14
MISPRWAIAACWGVFIIVWAITSLQVKASVRQRGFNRSAILWRLVVFVVAVGVGEAVARGLLPMAIFPYGVRLAGVAITALGIGFAIWARLTLGRNWGMPMTVRENPELVTGGPYAFVRHPIYTGVLGGLLGTALVVGVWWFAVALLGCGYFLISARQEERDMLERFPGAYPTYKARTKQLIPFVY